MPPKRKSKRRLYGWRRFVTRSHEKLEKNLDEGLAECILVGASRKQVVKVTHGQVVHKELEKFHEQLWQLLPHGGAWGGGPP